MLDLNTTLRIAHYNESHLLAEHFVMSPFADNIRKLITQYKQILKRHLPARAFSTKINALQIKRTQLKHASDVELFHTIDRIIYEIESWQANKNIASSEYSGLDEFRDHIKTFIRNYAVKDNRVINRCQHASRTLVECIQLLSMPQNKENLAQLKYNIAHLRQHGHDEELQKIRCALQKININAYYECYENENGACNSNNQTIDKTTRFHHD